MVGKRPKIVLAQDRRDLLVGDHADAVANVVEKEFAKAFEFIAMRLGVRVPANVDDEEPPVPVHDLGRLVALRVAAIGERLPPSARARFRIS